MNNRSTRRLNNWLAAHKPIPVKKHLAQRKLERHLFENTPQQFSVVEFDADLSAARNPETSGEALAALYTKWLLRSSNHLNESGRHKWISAELASNPNSPKDLLADLSADVLGWSERIAANPAIKMLILEDPEWAAKRLGNMTLRICAPELVEECLPTYGDAWEEIEDDDEIPF